MLKPIEECNFWSQIMQDHSEFIFNALSPKEAKLIKTAHHFYQEWMKVYEQSELLMHTYDEDKNKALIDKAIQLLRDMIEFKTMVLNKIIECKISFNLHPSLISHMINEAHEFYRHLYNAISNKSQTIEELFILHQTWLKDASGHASAIICNLDPNEFIYIKEGRKFQKGFDNLFIQSIEYKQILERTGEKQNMIIEFHEQIKQNIYEFIDYLEKIKTKRLECKLLSILEPLILDHMIREEKYYLKKMTF